MTEPNTVPTRKIRKVLIANRGEIAVRVIRACRERGIRTVAIYSEPDRLGLPVLLADEAYPIGPAPSRESYLRGDAIVELAVRVGADAIHPGYGFLSERAGFSRACRDAGITFIGPSPEAIDAMGSKVESRRLMIAAGVPVVPGGQDPLPDLESAAAFGEKIGYPVMLKASAGGGGKGMRRIDAAEDLPSAYRAARSEAGASFGDDSVYMEKYIVEPRHVEIQVMGDLHGRVVSLNERECSLQRRHQKVVEEAPSPVVSPDLRRRMGEAAVKAASAVGYSNAGTCEFLLAKDGNFYFLEMNTRLQVEHPVTELVTGIDLVHTQIRVAEGEPLGPEFDDVQPRGHAIEVRLYAEDPFNRFAPSPGRIERLRWPDGPGVRVDSGVYEGSEVSIHYDPMLAKLIVWAADRELALQRLERALDEMRIEGIRTTVPLYKALLADPDFRSGNMDIGMLDRKLAANELHPPAEDGLDDLPLIAAALAHFEETGRMASTTPSTGGQRARWGLAARRGALRGGLMELIVRLGDREEKVRVRRSDDGYEVVVGDRVHHVDAAVVGNGARSLVIDGAQHEVSVRRKGDGWAVVSRYGAVSVSVTDPLTHLANQTRGGKGGRRQQRVDAYMPGRVVALLVKEGDEVTAGQGIVVLEAMKMENEIRAEHEGRITKLHVEPGQAVDAGSPLFEME